MAERKQYNVLIASFLEPEFVEQIRSVSSQLNVFYDPFLLPEPRYPCDHVGKPLTRSADNEQRWLNLLAQADIQFGFDVTHLDTLPEYARRLQWLQATSAGIGQTIKRLGYAERMPETIFTTASGVHSQPLAEFVVMSIIMHYKQTARLLEEQKRKHWERYAGTDLQNRTAGILGLGHNGSRVASSLRSLGMRVYGSDLERRDQIVDRYYSPEDWKQMLPQLDVLILTIPHTPQTERIVDEEVLHLLPRGAYIVNISRGIVIEEQALIAALQSGHLGGAALDVFEHEPLPLESPLWDMPQVLISPHSASTSDRENLRLTELFCDNLTRFLSDKPLRNVLDVIRLY
jgi:glyoxylate/hydroxypyruvate reductase A